MEPKDNDNEAPQSKKPMISRTDAGTALQLLYCLPEDERAAVARAWLIDLGAPSRG